MPRYNAAELARAVAAGVPRGAATFADDDAWHDYQEQWLSVFAPGEQLPPIGDQHRRTRWKAVSRQHKKMTAQLESDGAPIVVASSVAPVASSASALASSAAAASSASVASSSASSAADSSEAVHPITAPTAAPATTQHVASAASSSAATSSEAEPTSGDGSTLEPTAGDVYSCALPAAATQPALAPSSLVHVPSNKWVAEHAPLLSQLEIGQPLLTPSQRHATLSLRGHFAGRDDERLVEQEDVHYTLPPSDDESASAAKRRMKRHREREEAAIFRLELEAQDPGRKEKKAQLAEMARVIRESQEQDRQDKYEHPSSPSLDPPS
jgi:hypothetical protein